MKPGNGGTVNPIKVGDPLVRYTSLYLSQSHPTPISLQDHYLISMYFV
jgi:hypothetical protein